MVEFKIDREENVAKLIEVNARFWGSLQLAISCGVDFPYLLFQMAMEENIEEPVGYTIGLKSRWELGDLDHLLIRILNTASDSNLLPHHPTRKAVILNFLSDFFEPSVRNEILQFNDKKPFLYELGSYIKHVISKQHYPYKI